FIFDRKYDNSFIFSDNVEPVIIPPQARHPVLFYLWFEHSIPRLLRKINPDLFISPDGYLSLKSKIKSLVVIHDLNFEHYPKDIPIIARNHYRYYFPKYARKATRIATVSEYSKNDIIKQYNISPDKIDVVYNGSNELFKPVSENEKDNIRKMYTDGNPYFVFIGALHPRKNLVNLFKAFDLFRKSNSTNTKMLIVGEKKRRTQEIRQAYENLQYKNDVIFSGRLGITELQKVLGSALALTYVSYFEGFGIPIVESFQCNVPVITSNVTSMPEIAGDAALYADPFSVESIADAMTRIAFDKKLRDTLIVKGMERCKLYSWDQSAERLWKTIEKVLSL
ncbi:MAG: glycosyltransferase family 4 protein, partial [Bacteroidales bacterium]|nr:glycosyltransferase family 4 protein [Bacteroidales bacterium]